MVGGELKSMFESLSAAQGVDTMGMGASLSWEVVSPLWEAVEARWEDALLRAVSSDDPRRCLALPSVPRHARLEWGGADQHWDGLDLGAELGILEQQRR